MDEHCTVKNTILIDRENPYAGFPDDVAKMLRETIEFLEVETERKADPVPLCAHVLAATKELLQMNPLSSKKTVLKAVGMVSSDGSSKTILYNKITVPHHIHEKVKDLCYQLCRGILLAAQEVISIPEFETPPTRKNVERRGRLRPRHYSKTEYRNDPEEVLERKRSRRMSMEWFQERVRLNTETDVDDVVMPLDSAVNPTSSSTTHDSFLPA